MDKQALYQAIFRRKAVRKYVQTPLKQEKIDALMQAIEGFTPINSKEGIAFRVLKSEQLKGIMPVKTPQFLAVYANATDRGQINAAFMLQQADLWLSIQGMGSCWVGMPNPTREVAQVNGLSYCIALAFGEALEPTTRDPKDAKRKSLSEVTDRTDLAQLLEPARLAPSAVNRQPWYFTVKDKEILVFAKKTNPIAGAVFGDMPRFDLGIVLCHLWLSAMQEKMFDRIEWADTKANAPQGYRPVANVCLTRELG